MLEVNAHLISLSLNLALALRSTKSNVFCVLGTVEPNAVKTTTGLPLVSWDRAPLTDITTITAAIQNILFSILNSSARGKG